jgi:hypothetical protein
VRIDGAVERIGRVGPHAVHQLGARQDVARTLQQRLEQQVFVARQVQRLPAEDHARFMLAKLEADRRGRHRRRRQAPQHHADPGHQFARRKRLGDVIVGANLEAHDTVDLVAAGGQEDHRNVGELAQLAADVEPILVGQADVEHHQNGRVGGPHRVQRMGAQADVQRRETVGAQGIGDAIGDCEFIFNNQDRSRHAQPFIDRKDRVSGLGLRQSIAPLNPFTMKWLFIQYCHAIFTPRYSL